jgi:hypothetical protein
MRNAKAVKQFCRSLDGLQGSIALFPEGLSEFLFTAGYPGHYEEIEAIRDGLDDLGLYEVVLTAVTRSEALAREGKCDEAEMLVLEASRKLSKPSGAEDDLRRIYTSANESSWEDIRNDLQGPSEPADN